MLRCCLGGAGQTSQVSRGAGLKKTETLSSFKKETPFHAVFSICIRINCFDVGTHDTQGVNTDSTLGAVLDAGMVSFLKKIVCRLVL